MFHTGKAKDERDKIRKQTMGKKVRKTSRVALRGKKAKYEVSGYDRKPKIGEFSFRNSLQFGRVASGFLINVLLLQELIFRCPNLDGFNLYAAKTDIFDGSDRAGTEKT